jgi:hypothetical protein
LHGGLIIDFIGQQGPSSKFHLAVLDLSVLVLQVVMLSVHLKRIKLKKRLPKLAGSDTTTTTSTDSQTAEHTTDPGQDADAEERGVLRRTDTFSDLGQEPDEEDELLPATEDASSSPSVPGSDLLDALNSGQVVVADLHVLTLLWEEHQSIYSASSGTQTSGAGNAAGASFSSNIGNAVGSLRMRMATV